MGKFSHNIKYHRTKEGYTQAQYAEILGVNRANINTYEKGTIPKEEFLVALHQQFNLDLNMFLLNEMSESNYEYFFIATKMGEVSGSLADDLLTVTDPNKLKEIATQMASEINDLKKEKSVLKGKLVQLKEIVDKIRGLM